MWVGGGAVCTAAGGLLGFGPVVHVVGRRFASAHGSGAVPFASRRVPAARLVGFVRFCFSQKPDQAGGGFGRFGLGWLVHV